MILVDNYYLEYIFFDVDFSFFDDNIPFDMDN
jgi:hypothetical protein